MVKARQTEKILRYCECTLTKISAMTEWTTVKLGKFILKPKQKRGYTIQNEVRRGEKLFPFALCWIEQTLRHSTDVHILFVYNTLEEQVCGKWRTEHTTFWWLAFTLYKGKCFVAAVFFYLMDISCFWEHWIWKQCVDGAGKHLF